MRLPSVSYWPPWHGQPKPAGWPASAEVDVALPSVLTLLGSRIDGPVRLHRAAEVRAAVREDREARLAFSSRPLLRMYAVRRETSPSRGSSTKVVTTNLPSGKFESGPRSTSWTPAPRSAGATTKPSGGTVTTPPISAPEPERRALEELVAREALGLGRRLGARSAGAPAGAASATAAARPWPRRRECDRSRTQRSPKTIAIAAPIGDRHPADDEPDEQDGDADREADRPEGRGRNVRSCSSPARAPLRDSSLSLDAAQDSNGRWRACQRRNS